MELWFTMETLVYEKKTMVLCKKLYREIWNFTKEKHGRLPKTRKLCLLWKKNYSDIPKYVKFLNKFIHLELWFTLEKHGSMEKLIIVILRKKLWYDRKKLLYYTENYGILIYYGKTLVLCKKTNKLWNHSKL